MSGKNVLIIGPGFIGWNVLDLLVAEGYHVTGLVRRNEHAEQIKTSGAEAELGDLDDKAKIADLTIQNDIVFHTATADHLPSVEAVLNGVKKRADQGLSTIFIHTSGTSVLDDGSHGAFKGEKIYTDETRKDIDSVPDDAPHREIDLAIVKAQNELGDKAKLAIMIPPLIYGFNPSHNRLTIQIPTLTRFALKHGYVPHIGPGLAVESNIHVLDLARAYLVLLSHLLSTPAVQTLENTYFFCESTGDNEPSWKEVADAIAEGLNKAGKGKFGVRELEKKDEGDLFGEWTPAVVGLNSRSRAVRLRGFGWEAREKGWRESFLEEELPRILEEKNEGWKGYFSQGVVKAG